MEIVTGSKSTGRQLPKVSTVIGWGLFVTMLGQTSWIGSLPIKFLLKDTLRVDPPGMAMFLALTGLAWYFKPLIGILSDSVPLFGSRRRAYLLLGSGFASVLWFLMAVASPHLRLLLVTAIALNMAVVVASTVIGGILVEEGQARNATGRFSSMRGILKTGAAMIAGPLTGYLAARPFSNTSAIGMALFASLFVYVAIFFREDVSARRSARAQRAVISELLELFRSRALWAAVIMLFLVELAPGFHTPLFYYQTDVLRFDGQFLGYLGLFGGVFGLLAGFIYAFACKRLPLRSLLYLALATSALTSLSFMVYRSRSSAVVVECVSGFGVMLGQLPLFDLAARAAPRGTAALAYALMMSAWNFATAISDIIGAWLFHHLGLSFIRLVWLNAGATTLTLLLIPLLPISIVSRCDSGRLGGKSS
jgi:predicted MFS family arabinose efflux permease